MTDNIKLTALLTIGTWIGMVIGLSFIEAPIKFQAPGITLALGLGIGKLVFGILSKIEIVFSVVLLIVFFGSFKEMNKWHKGSLFAIVLIVVWQAFILLPVLDHRADMVIASQPMAATYHHMAYVIAEAVKLFLLFLLFVQSFRFKS